MSNKKLNREKKLRVLQILPDLNSGGVERGTLEIAACLIKEGYETFVVSNSGSLVNQLTNLGVKHITLPVHSKNPFTMLINIFRVYNVIKKYDIDIVHARSRAPAWVAYFASKLARRIFVTTFHSAYSADHPLKRFYNSIMLKGRRVIAISEFIKKHIETRYQFKSDKLIVIQRGVDLSYFSVNEVSDERVVKVKKALGLKKKINQKILLLPARFTRLKGHLYLINALQYLKNKDFICIMVGKKTDKQFEYFKEIETIIKDLNFVNKIILHDQPITDMPALYKIADIVLCTSLEPEGFGRTLIEGQAMERILISINSGGPAEIIEDEVTGFLGPVSDAATFAKVIDKALEVDSSTRRKILDAAYKKVNEQYSLKLMCSKTLKIYHELMQETRQI